jgi:hypothetical protein
LHALRELVHNGHRAKTEIILAEVLEQPLVVLTNSGLVDELGSDNVVDSLDAALERAGEIAALRGPSGTHAVASGR